MHKLTEPHPIRCRCGRLQGQLARGTSVARVACYCLDCQTYAHALGRSHEVLDARGGTDVITTVQSQLSFSDRSTLACLSLSERGILRWYASCCATPLGNTMRDPRIAYISVVHACLAPTRDALLRPFGPPGMAVNTGHAYEPVASGGLRTALTLAEGIARVAFAGVDGSWRRSPLFDPASRRPVVERRVLSADERRAAREAARRAGAR